MRLAALTVFAVLALGGCGGRTERSNAVPVDSTPGGGIPETYQGSAEAGSVCNTAADCAPTVGTEVSCCIDNVCGGDVPLTCADGGQKPIVAYNYDQTCDADTDCVAIAQGNACSALGPPGTAAINRGALARYNADTAGTPCFDPNPWGDTPACCTSGICAVTGSCQLRQSGPPDDSACKAVSGNCTAMPCEPYGWQNGPANSCTNGLNCCLL